MRPHIFFFYFFRYILCHSLNCLDCKEKETVLDLNLSDCEECDKLITYDAGWFIVRGPEQCELDTLIEEAIYCKRMIATKSGEVENHFETIMINTTQLFVDLVCNEGLTTQSIFNSLNKEYNKWLTGKKEEKEKKEGNTMDDKKKALVKFDNTTFIPGCCYELTNMINSFRYVMLLKSYAEDEPESRNISYTRRTIPMCSIQINCISFTIKSALIGMLILSLIITMKKNTALYLNAPNLTMTLVYLCSLTTFSSETYGKSKKLVQISVQQ